MLVLYINEKTLPMSSLYTEANEAPLAERRLNLSMHFYVKLVPVLTIQHIMPCMNSTESLQIYMLLGQMEGGMTRPLAPPIGLKVEEAMTSAEINAELVCPPEDTQLSTRNSWLRSQETRPHWRST